MKPLYNLNEKNGLIAVHDSCENLMRSINSQITSDLGVHILNKYGIKFDAEKSIVETFSFDAFDLTLPINKNIHTAPLMAQLKNELTDLFADIRE